MNDEKYQEELDYLVQYARTSLLHFIPLRDAAENVTGGDGSEADIQAATVRLVGDMIDQGVAVGDLSPREGEEFLPWNVSKGEALARIAEGMRTREDPLDFMDICWFLAEERSDLDGS
ncbi:hypothetical protein ACFVIM_35000 [Streptomyces sp. NPDC057638]|uniref:hypothetical protein n=1 Tax=Streptomyces sp. NPDC057638 TaxID=3346190 RepID=UPI00369F3B3A